MKKSTRNACPMVGVALLSMLACHSICAADSKPAIAIIGTGDMGDSLGPRLAGLGYRVTYGSRDPDGDRTQQLLELTGHDAEAKKPADAAADGDIVILAVPWPAMENVAQSLGSLDGKIVVDISMPSIQGEDGYPVPLLDTSSAEMIAAWNPGARLVKAFATQGSFVIDDPAAVGGPVTVPIASNDRDAKEIVASIAVEMGLDPVDAGPLRMARDIEALQRLYMVPLVQHRAAAWEPYFRRSYYWACFSMDDSNQPIFDAGDLAQMPETQGPARPCPGP
jgi:predicted dinucleotide-binding enzyme